MRLSLLYILLFCLAALSLAGCDSHAGDDGSYRVTVELRHGRLHCDSATLVVVDEDYGRLRLLGGAHVEDSVFTFVGHTPEPRLAYIDFATDSLPLQFYFVLEPTHITITLEPGRWLIKGGKHNQSYQAFLNRHTRLLASRDSLWHKYVSMGSDSTLTWDKERAALRTDSLLQDSLQRITVERINRGDLASCLVKQRLLPTLTRESLDKIK